MQVSIEINPEQIDPTLAIISACLVPVVMNEATRHVLATGRAPTEEDMKGFRTVALGNWIQIFSMIKSELTIIPPGVQA